MARQQGGQVVWELDGDNKNLLSSLDESEDAVKSTSSSIDKLGDKMSKSIGKTFSTIGNILTNSVTVGVTAFASSLIALGTKGIQSASELQTLQISLNGLTKSADLGAQAMAGALKYAQQAPFQLPEVAGTVKTLIAFGIQAKDAVGLLELLGNVSITTGVNLSHLGGIFGQISANGKLMLGDIRQLTENGVAILPALQAQFGKTAEEVAAMATAGEISFEQFRDAMATLVDPKILEQLENTLPRQIDRLGGSIRILSNAFVNVGVDAVNGFTQASDGIYQAAIDIVRQVATTLRSPQILQAATSMGAVISAQMQKIIKFIEPVILGIARIGQAFVDMGALILPILGLAIGGLGGLAAGIPVLGPLLAGITAPMGLLVGSILAAIIKIKEFRDAFVDAGGTFAQTFSQMKPIFDQTLGIFSDMAATVGKALVPVVHDLAVAIRNIFLALSPVIPVIAEFISQLVTALIPILPPIIKGFGEITSALINALAPVLPELTAAIIDLVVALVPLIPQLVEMAVVVIQALIPYLPELVRAFILFTEAIIPLLPVIVPLIPALVGFKAAAAGMSAVESATSTLNIFGKSLSLLKLELLDIQGIGDVFSFLGKSSGLTEAGGAFKNLLSVVGSVMSSIVTIISIAARGIGAAIFSIPVVGWILLAITTLVGLFTYFYTQSEDFRNFVNGVFEGIGKGITDSFNGIVQFFTDMWNGINESVNTVQKFFTDVFTSIGLTVYNTFLAIQGFYNTYLKPTIDGIIYVVNALGTIISVTFNTIAQVVGIVVGTLVQILGVALYGTLLFLYNNVVKPVFEGIASVIITNLTIAAAVITTIWNAIVAFFSPILQFLGKIISDTFNGIKDVIVVVWNGIAAFLMPIVQFIINFLSERFNNLVNNIKFVFNLIKTYIINPIGEAISYISRTIGQIADNIGRGLQDASNRALRFGGDFLQAGKNIIDGLVKGITQGGPQLVEKVRQIAAGALNEVKKFFGIKSPSTVFAEIGDYLMQGLSQGIEDGSGETIKTAQSVAQDVIGSMNNVLSDGVSVTATGTISDMAAPDVFSQDQISQNSRPSLSSGITINQTNTVNTELDMDVVNRNLTWELSKI